MKWDLLLLIVTLALMVGSAIRREKNMSAHTNSIAAELAPKIGREEGVVREELSKIYGASRARVTVVHSAPFVLIALLLIWRMIVNSRFFPEIRDPGRVARVFGLLRSRANKQAVVTPTPQVLYGHEFITWNLFLVGIIVAMAGFLWISGLVSYVTEGSNVSEVLAPKIDLPVDHVRDTLTDVLQKCSEQESLERSVPLAILAVFMGVRLLVDRRKE